MGSEPTGIGGNHHVRGLKVAVVISKSIGFGQANGDLNQRFVGNVKLRCLKAAAKSSDPEYL